MTFSSRVFTGDPPDLVGRSPEDYARELEAFLRRTAAVVTESIPAGFLGTTPTNVAINAAANPGTENAGWAPADHVHALDLGLITPGDLLTRNATSYTRRSGGTVSGQVLTWDPADPTQMTWQASTYARRLAWYFGGSGRRG